MGAEQAIEPGEHRREVARRGVAVVVAVGTQTIADVGYTYLNPRIRFT